MLLAQARRGQPGYDQGGRLAGEDYVQCTESGAPGDGPPSNAEHRTPVNAIGLGEEPARVVDVTYHFDAPPAWSGGTPTPPSATFPLGRLTGVNDRGQRSVVDYDARGDTVWAARQATIARMTGLAAGMRP